MARKSTFTKGSTTFICTSCGHNTRNTGDQSIDAKVCPICWDLAGYENSFQDGELDAEGGKYVTGLFLELKAKRTPEQYAKALNSFDLLVEYYPVEGAEVEVATPAEVATGETSTATKPVEICRALKAAEPTLGRKEFIAKAIALGVHKATASAQFHRIK